MSDTEKRILFTVDSKFTTAPSTNGGPGILTGYALVWNQKSSDRGGFKVTLAKNSAKFTATTYGLWNHSYDSPLACTDNGTLTLTPDDYGVKATMQLPDTTAGRDAYENVKTGLVKGMSFGMLMDGAEFTTAMDDSGDEVDTFTSFQADEVTITPIPAFTGTSINAGVTTTRRMSKWAQSKSDAVRQSLQAEIDKHNQYQHDLYGTAFLEV
jgi:HK97 family phage prohead protease